MSAEGLDAAPVGELHGEQGRCGALARCPHGQSEPLADPDALVRDRSKARQRVAEDASRALAIAATPSAVSFALVQIGEFSFVLLRGGRGVDLAIDTVGAATTAKIEAFVRLTGGGR